ncbi:MAG: FadR family transcriptional regulator [Thermoleophilia bacterium]|jgi:DNA-binding FadR family transcriptional regulator|nr:FadR family transcriptional regulator [Thermoleophilia bacterium]
MDQLDTDRTAEPRAGDFPPIELPRAADAVTRALIDGLRSGAAEIGSRLPRDLDLAAHFGVSRVVVRDSLDKLRRAGLLEIRRGQGGGATVRSLSIPTDLLTSLGDLDSDEIRELLEARRVIETATAAGAGRRASESDLADLERLTVALDGAREDPEAFIELDVRFHLRIAAASSNPQLTRFLSSIFRDLASARSRYPSEYGSMEAAVANQRETLEALSSGDSERIAASIDRHLGNLEEHFIGRPLSA